jgi:hypothetical protein
MLDGGGDYPHTGVRRHEVFVQDGFRAVEESARALPVGGCQLHGREIVAGA